jgi:hypothetical protein
VNGFAATDVPEGVHDMASRVRRKVEPALGWLFVIGVVAIIAVIVLWVVG